MARWGWLVAVLVCAPPTAGAEAKANVMPGSRTETAVARARSYPSFYLRLAFIAGLAALEQVDQSDDHVLADSLSSKLDELEWHISSPTLFTDYHDPLDDMDHNF